MDFKKIQRKNGLSSWFRFCSTFIVRFSTRSQKNFKILLWLGFPRTIRKIFQFLGLGSPRGPEKIFKIFHGSWFMKHFENFPHVKTLIIKCFQNFCWGGWRASSWRILKIFVMARGNPIYSTTKTKIEISSKRYFFVRVFENNFTSELMRFRRISPRRT